MNVKEWAASQLTNRTAYDFFSDCWNVVFQKQCASNQIVIDAGKYLRRGDIPYYVHRRFEMWKRTQAVLPSQAQKMARWDAPWCHQAYRLVSDYSPPLIAHKGADGVWRS